MGDQLVNALGDHLMRAVLLSGVAALVIVGLVALVWWQTRRSIRGRYDARPIDNPRRSVAQMDERRETGASASGDRQEGYASTSSSHSREDWGGRLVRDAAVRAAALRDAWDRSYRPARRGDAAREPAQEPTASDLADLVRELRLTNELLRDLVSELRGRR